MWKRIPASIKKGDRQLCAVWDIAKCLWTKDYICVYPAFQAYDWDVLHKTLIVHLEGKLLSLVVVDSPDSFRKRTVDLISRSYQTISPANLANFLGVSLDAATKCTKQDCVE